MNTSPMPDQDKNVESTLIWFNRKAESQNSYWGKELQKFIEKSMLSHVTSN